MLSEEEYKNEWLNGQHNTDYNNCRFTEDKVSFAKEWLLSKQNNINFDNPKNINDIICKQKLKIITNEHYCDKCQEWADKAQVQTLLKNKGYSEYIIPTEYIIPKYIENRFIINEKQIKDSIEKFKESVLFLKCNHGSGWNIRIDKSKLTSFDYITNKLNEWISLNYAYISGYEKQYENIKPIILVQPELIFQPIDYSFWCINGKIDGISLTKKFGKNFEEYIAFVDEYGKSNYWFIGLEPEWVNLPNKFISYIDKMKPFVNEISKEFDFVRVDMYYINDCIYFGEATFTPSSGINDLTYR